MASRRQAAAWLWVSLAGGDHLLSPAFSARDSESDREAYRRFVKQTLPGGDVFLEEYGRRLVDTAAKIPGQVEKTAPE